jgi:serine/threonine protein kinase
MRCWSRSHHHEPSRNQGTREGRIGAHYRFLTPGTRLGPYEIESLLGTGGMGEVYKAHDGRLNRTVAIKRLIADNASQFQSEAPHHTSSGLKFHAPRIDASSAGLVAFLNRAPERPFTRCSHSPQVRWRIGLPSTTLRYE